MKKLLLLLGLWALILPLVAQNMVVVNGTVFDIDTGNPIPHYSVIIHADSMNSIGYPFHHEVMTNEEGHYIDNIPVGPTITNGSIVVSTFDCTSAMQLFVLNFGPGNYSLTQNFSICREGTECHAHFIAENIGPLAFQFTNTSDGGGISFWVFGDGTSSTEMNPIHTFPGQGHYDVQLTISSPDSSCWDQVHEMIFVGDSIPPVNCHAYFESHEDEMTPLQIDFTNLSTGNLTSFHWDFGDGTDSTITFPANPNFISHQYSAEGTYNVCFTVQGIDTTCVSTFCHQVEVHNHSQECKAEFRFDHDPGSPPAALHFVDKSHSQGPISWNWNFGDGTYSNEQNPIHEFSQMGFYQVCLTISSNDSSCYDTECRQVNVGEPQHCEAQFTYYPDSLLSSDVFHFVDLSYGNVTSWMWDFGDPASGINNTSTVQNPTHTFTSGQHFHVCLEIESTINDTVPCQSTWCREVEIGEPSQCINYFTYQNAGLSVSFEGHLLSGLEATYTWDFGDDQIGEGQNIVHTYSSSGIYFVSLTTVDVIGCESSSSHSIIVGDSSSWNQIYGQVFAGNFPSEGGLVLLFSVDTTNSYVPFFATSFVNPQGVYNFPMVPQGNYVLYAIPFTFEYVPTYYGDVLNWQTATVISLGVPNNPYDIHLLPATGYMHGDGSISGQISQGDISASVVDKVTMLLKNVNGNTVAYIQVDASGNFVFPQLAYGTYYLHAELAGCTSDNIKVEITADNPTAEVMMTLSGHNILGVFNATLIEESVVVYPVPVRDIANISVSLPKSNELTIQLFNMSGLLVYQDMVSVNSGATTLTIPFANFENGIYQLSIVTQDGLRINKKLVKTN